MGLTLPTLISASTTALPAARFGTGSALVNMGCQGPDLRLLAAR